MAVVITPNSITGAGTIDANVFTGSLTGNVTGNVSGTAGGLTGTPNITVGTVTATSLSGIGVVAPGTVIALAYAASGTTLASLGYLKCNGAQLSITSYTILYNLLTTNGTVFPFGANTNGSGVAGSTHFLLPDLRGEFVRGWVDNRTGVDDDTTFGRFQAATRVYRNHYRANGSGYGNGAFDADSYISSDYDGNIETTRVNNRNQISSAGSPQSVTVEGVRVRPRNIALLYCIKF